MGNMIIICAAENRAGNKIKDGLIAEETTARNQGEKKARVGQGQRHTSATI